MKMMRGDRTLWDDEDGFFYDLLRFPDGTTVPFRVRSLVGLIPLYAVERLERTWIEPFAVFRENLDWFMKHRRDIVEHCVTTVAATTATTRTCSRSSIRTSCSTCWRASSIPTSSSRRTACAA